MSDKALYKLKECMGLALARNVFNVILGSSDDEKNKVKIGP